MDEPLHRDSLPGGAHLRRRFERVMSGLVALVAATVLPSAAALAQDVAMRLTRDQEVRYAFPETVASPTRAKAGAMVVVAVHGHVPPRQGAVAFEVELVCGQRRVSLGNAAVFPALRFTPADAGKIQRFQFAWPFDADCVGRRDLTLRLIAEGGDGEGASFDIESIDLVMP